MKAAVLHAPRTPFQIQDVTLNEPRAGEVLLRVAAAGVCHSDYHLLTGATPHPMPVVCGHEGAGVVQATGPGVTRVKPGDHVVLSWAPSCGSCFYCEHGLPAQCQTYLKPIWDGTMMDGTTRLRLASRAGSPEQPLYHYAALASFAEATVVPESCCIPIRSDAPLDVAALVGCAVTTGVGAVLFRAKLEPGNSAAVFGCGGVGMSIVMGSALAGAGRIIAVDVNRAKLDLALELGATHAVNSGEADPVQAIRKLTEGRGADYTFEAIGAPAVMTQAIDAARRGGTILLVGLGGRSENISLGAGSFTRSDKVLTSAYYGLCDPRRDMPEILDLHMDGKLPIHRLIGRRRPLEEINEAFDEMLSGDIVRTVITFAP